MIADADTSRGCRYNAHRTPQGGAPRESKQPPANTLHPHEEGKARTHTSLYRQGVVVTQDSVENALGSIWPYHTRHCTARAGARGLPTRTPPICMCHNSPPKNGSCYNKGLTQHTHTHTTTTAHLHFCMPIYLSRKDQPSLQWAIDCIK